VWSGGAAVVAVLLVIAGWFLLISPQRSAAADLRDQTASQQAMNDQTRVKTKQLQAQFASLPERQAQLAEIKQQMPDNPALPSLIRDLSSYADSAGVTLVSVAPGTPQAETADASAQAPVAPGTKPAPVAGTQLMSIPTVVTASGTYSELTLYLQKLQSSMRRAFLVEGIQLSHDSSGTADKASSADALQVTITGKIFQLSTTAGAAPGTATPPTTTTPAN
jgi:type IV pilus assembly protein PilO